MKSYLNNLESDLKCINHRFNQYDESFKEWKNWIRILITLMRNFLLEIKFLLN
jgi:hypothetical protein